MFPITHEVKNDMRSFYRIAPLNEFPSGSGALAITWSLSLKERIRIFLSGNVKTCIRISKRDSKDILMEMEI